MGGSQVLMTDSGTIIASLPFHPTVKLLAMGVIHCQWLDALLKIQGTKTDNGSYSAVGIYSLRDESLGASLYVYHFDQNTVSVSISPSCDYIVVGYAGRGPFYRIVHPSRNNGQILSLTRYGDQVKLVPVKELVADNQTSLVSVNCMHWVPIPGYGIIYGTNTGEVILLN